MISSEALKKIILTADMSLDLIGQTANSLQYVKMARIKKIVNAYTLYKRAQVLSPQGSKGEIESEKLSVCVSERKRTRISKRKVTF